MQAYRNAVSQIPDALGAALRALPDHQAAQVTEIRLRAGRLPVLSRAAGPLVLEGCSPPTEAQLHRVLEALCGYSIYRYHQKIAQGYITLAGGHRLGLAGRLVEGADGRTLDPVTGMNLRVARQIRTPLCPQLRQLLADSGGILLAGPPGCGKTTVLRQMLAELSARGLRVCAVDERDELAGGTLPLHCDILQGCGKAEGLLWAVRSLSPQVLVCDEVGGTQDAAAICSAANAGVRLIVTMHAADAQTLMRRPQCRQILQTGAFSTLVLLEGEQHPGQVKEVHVL